MNTKMCTIIQHTFMWINSIMCLVSFRLSHREFWMLKSWAFLVLLLLCLLCCGHLFPPSFYITRFPQWVWDLHVVWSIDLSAAWQLSASAKTAREGSETLGLVQQRSRKEPEDYIKKAERYESTGNMGYFCMSNSWNIHLQLIQLTNQLHQDVIEVDDALLEV